MELARFLAYLLYMECAQIEQRRLYYVFKGPDNELEVSVPRKYDYLERETIYLICNSLGIDMPEKFREFQQALDKIYRK